MTYFRFITGWMITAALSILLLFPIPASAHKISIFAWVEGNMVHTQSRFMGNRIPNTARIEVLDADGKQLLKGSLDAEGRFSFAAPYKGNLEIILHASAGHRAIWRLKADDFDMDSAATAEGYEHSHPLDTANQESGREVLTEEKVLEMVTALLRKEIEPLKKMMADPSRVDPSFRDIIGGIGYIFGLVGVAAYVRSRRK